MTEAAADYINGLTVDATELSLRISSDQPVQAPRGVKGMVTVPVSLEPVDNIPLSAMNQALFCQPTLLYFFMWRDWGGGFGIAIT